MARAKKLEKNLILAELVEKWARKHNLKTDVYVQQFLKALISKENLAMWATIDPLEVLPYPKVTRDRKIRRIAKNLVLWRNALVFAPVAFTWLAVGQATSAFQKYTEENLTATVNFLQFWQNGYGVLDEKWRIGTVAITDAVIVFAVIFLTISLTFLNNKAKELRDSDEEVVLVERLQIAIAIKEFLFTKHSPTKLSLNQGVVEAVENLVEVTEKLKRRRRR
jgi:hypothetical protein